MAGGLYHGLLISPPDGAQAGLRTAVDVPIGASDAGLGHTYHRALALLVGLKLYNTPHTFKHLSTLFYV